MSSSNLSNTYGIIIIDESGNISKRIKNISNDKRYNFYIAKSKEDALTHLKQKNYEIVITETKTPIIDDYEVIKFIKDSQSDSCIIVTSNYSSVHEALKTLKSGAFGFIPQPFDEDTIRLVLNKAVERQELFKERNHFRELSMLDGLTSVFNRRFFQEIISTELSRSGRFKHHLSLILIDIDNFKHFNDTYGHVVGDKILKEFSDLLVKNVRTIDYVCRYGGDEFTIVLPETNKEGTFNLARRLKNSMMQNKFITDDKIETHLSISIGISTFPQDADKKDSLIEKADKALYDAKKLGKGQICFFQDHTGK
ncbi:diguanylate cyclase [Candidatus Poribacteria bacterium]|nr:diguanylate cyclase [Candidatus Poribacteria bacterium]